MQKKNGHENLLRPKARNERQQIEPRRNVEDRGVSDEIQGKHAIENNRHFSSFRIAQLSNSQPSTNQSQPHRSAPVDADLISITGVPSNASIGPIFTRVALVAFLLRLPIPAAARLPGLSPSSE
jgi:hypothetical protein